MIDTYEMCDVVTLNIPGAFLQTKLPADEKEVHVILDGRMAELLAKIAPDVCQKYVHHKRDSHTSNANSMWHEQNSEGCPAVLAEAHYTSLKTREFVINTYDWCIVNKTISGSQCTIAWYINNLNILHKSSAVVDEFDASLKVEYRKQVR